VNELDRQHRSEAPHVADGVPALLPGNHASSDRLADRGRALVQALLLEDVQHGHCSCLRDGVADVGAADRRVAGRIHDLGLADHTGERQTGCDRLRDGDQIGLDSVVLDREELAGAAEPRLNLVDYHDDPVLVAEPADAVEERLRRDDKAALALDGLDHDRRDRLGGDLRDQRALEGRERLVGAGPAVIVRERHPVDLGRERP
jgi:hypothetical protein